MINLVEKRRFIRLARNAWAAGSGFVTTGVFNDHSARHENAGADEISVAGLSGQLADLQLPVDHTHQSAGLGVGGKLDHGAALTGLTDDDHTQYRLESEDHSHQSTGAQAGQLDHGLAMSAASLLDDDHTQYRLESADHSHQSTGLQGGKLDHGLALDGLGDDDHPQYATNVEFDDHSARHENAGADEISVAGLSGELADAQPVAVSKNSGATVGTRSELNFIEGANITLTIADDAGNDEIDITITGAAGGGGDFVQSAILGTL